MYRYSDVYSLVLYFVDHVWQVTVKPQGLAASGKALSAGVYRLCLNKTSVFFIKLHKDEPDMEFQVRKKINVGYVQ